MEQRKMTLAIASFSFEWDLSNYLDIEIWMADTIRKQMANPGEGFPDNAKGYVNFLIELRDADGNISRRPRLILIIMVAMIPIVSIMSCMRMVWFPFR